ncbi:ATP-dependent DNA helicase RecG [Leucobacter weissii]|uniref:Probable DNA 3'-5' helicase RecG n=1 Tax=Leucobacter weissii TaxID=1983706 RepID=A0A939SB69_9MICO|nr:ATP-dependent DNA helicase RecG [Leucobacter weissii]MBO1901093.1 ATP-dependent DNA helicase RecG [Leucobacter weissii]
MTAATLDSRLDGVVGGRTAAALQRAFELRTVRELLWHVPRRYSNRGDLTPLTGLPVGEHVTVLAQVLDVRERRMQRRNGKLLEARITDGTGTLQLTFFNQAWRAAELVPGARGIFAGKVSEYRGQLQLQHPDYELFEDREVGSQEAAALDRAAARAYAERPVPIYPATAKLPSWSIQQAIALALDALGPVEDPLPAELLRDEGLLPLSRALELIHRPENAGDWRRAQESLRFREAFELQLALLHRRRGLGAAPAAPRPPVEGEGGLLAAFDRALPFALTNDQRRAAETISAELARPHPMHRLLQGEVGSGKTVVALRAMIQVAESPAETEAGAAPGDGQSALLAPTEVLAAQHFRSVVDALGPELVERLQPVLITSSMPAAEKRRALLAVAGGGARIVIGTHALLSDNVAFYDLGLAVIDEQHRFGVEQRDALRRKGTVLGAEPEEGDAKREAPRRKGAQPHLLVMTATPIPRTVALTAFGDLETSVIRELPAGRQGIETFVVPLLERPKWAERAWVRALEEVAAGRQVYVVCPAIAPGEREEGEREEGEATDAEEGAARPLASVEQTFAELSGRADYAGIGIASLTGAMRPDDKDATMRAFAAGGIDVLVATTVIEVGVNVPNASVMIVRDADRFGISQLHQLRGRVGRGDHPGLCLLLTAAPTGSVARERLEAVAATLDGFELAEKDLELRREGDILGTAQSGGRSALRLLRVTEHGELIDHARSVAESLLERDPELMSAPGLAEVLEREAQQRRLDNLAKS